MSGFMTLTNTSLLRRTWSPHPESTTPTQPAAADMANHSFDPNVEVRPTGAGIGLFARKQVG